MNKHQDAGKIVIIYALFGCVWIYFSDTALGWFGHDSEPITKIAVFKEFLFIVCTSILLFFLITLQNSKIKQSTNSLHESEERFRFYLKNSSDSLVILNADGSQRYVSPGAERITGFPIAELEGRSIDTLIHPEDMKRVMDAWNEAVEHPEKSVTVQYRHIHKTQEWVFFEAIAQSFLNEPATHGVIACVRDITEHKRVERFLRDVIAKNPMSIQILDNDGLTLEVNHSYKELFGSVPPDGYSIFSDPQLLRMGMGTLFDQLRNGTNVLFPDTYFNAHDSIAEFPDVPAWIRTLGFPLNDNNEKPERFVLMHENITERKQAEDALRESEETFRNIIQASPMGIHLYQLHTDDRLVFVGANPAADNLLGVDNTRFIGMTLEEAFPPLQHTEIPLRYRRAAQHGESWHTEQIEYKHDKIVGAFEVYAFQMSLGKVAVLFNDITGRKLAEKERERLQMQLTQAQKMEAVGQLAGGVAHDFNNMLSVIIGYSELLLKQVPPSQQFHAELLQIQKAAHRSADLTRQLLTFARKQTVAPSVLDLNQTIEGMLTMLRRLIGENINLLWMPGSRLWPVKVDPTQIDQILANLSVNARDAIAGVGRIIVETANSTFDDAYCVLHAGFLPGEYVRISVNDNGCGMDQETLPHIFEPFFTTKGVGAGTGLGLASVYGAVKQNRGFINVESEPGQGTIFSIYLPRHVDDLDQSQKTISVAEPALRGHETILLVEDEIALLDMLSMMLQELGYTVLVAGAPSDVHNLIATNDGKIDMLLTDVIMPEMNGRELAERLLLYHPGMKCLFMSGYTADIIAHHGVLNDGLNFIQKPFLNHELAAMVRKALDRGKAS